MKCKLFWLLLLFTWAIFSHQIAHSADTAPSDKLILQTISSQFLSEPIQLKVHLPNSYATSNEKYPVLFVLDSQWHFANAVAIQKALRVPDDLPEMIIVGIQSEEPIRRTWFGRQRDGFQQMLADELIPFVDTKWRTSSERVLFGWEAAAGFASYSLFDKKALFNGFIVSNGGRSPSNQDQPMSKAQHSNQYLYLANSDRDIYTIAGSNKLAAYLSENDQTQLNWVYRKFNDETHESLPYLAMYHGLKFHFHNYKRLAFISINEFNQRGGFDYLADYYAQRGKRFNLPQQIDNGTKNNLIWLAWNRNNFEYFEIFMARFKDVLTTRRYDSAYWQNRFARFYLKHGRLDVAQQYFIAAIKKYPNQAILHEGLAQVLLLQKQPQQAKTALSKAIEIAQGQSDPRVSQYQQTFDSINTSG